MSLIELFNNLMQVHASLGNLSKDVDKNDKREQTKEDLEGLTANFDQVVSLFKSMNSQDLQALYGEAMEFATGKQSFAQYLKDVNNILQNIRTQSQKDPGTKQKIEQNLPQKFQNQNIDELLDNYQKVVNELREWQQSAKSRS